MRNKIKFKSKKIDDGTLTEELKSQLARALADYDNLRKRVEEEREIWIKFSSERVIIKLLPILDAFEAAQVHLGDQGLAIAVGEFKKVLSEEGIEEIKPGVGDEFDENIHEAMEIVEGEKKATGPVTDSEGSLTRREASGQEGKIAELVLTGWKFGDGKIIRFAKVKVTKSS